MRLSTLANSLSNLARQLLAAVAVPMLRRKLWADLRALSRQVLSLLVLIGVGVMLFVCLYAAYQYLDVTYNTVYERTHFADASVLVQSAPEGLVQKAKTIPHVRDAIGRIVRDGSIIQKGKKRERVVGRFIGVPANRRQPINDVWITEGHYLRSGDEVVLTHQFAKETGYEVGDTLKCSYLGRERRFKIVGLATSPEYLYPVPSEYTLFVSRGSFGVVFVEQDRARQWLGLGRRITEIHTLTDPGYEKQVLEKLEALARTYGVESSYTQQEQPSRRLLKMDLEGFATMSVFFPVLFLLAAGLSLYGALSRIIRLQIVVIGTLKASGFDDLQIMIHYVLQGTLVAVGGAVPGVIIGHILSLGIGRMYINSLKIPMFYSEPQWGVMAAGLLLAGGTGFASALLPARMAARLRPAVAMRGDVEPAAGRALLENLARWFRLTKVVLLIPLRGIFRRASRTALALAGIAGGTVILMTTFGMYLSTLDAIDEYIIGTRKYQIDLQFTSPDGANLASAVTALDGAYLARRTTSLPVEVSSSWGTGKLMLTGLERGQQMLDVRTVGGNPMYLRPGYIWLPRRLCRRLHLEPGDPVRVQWVKSTRRRPVETTMRVAGLLDVSMGNSAYGEYKDIRRCFSDRIYPESSYGAHIACDPERETALKHRLERSDRVAAVQTTSDIKSQIDEQMAIFFIFTYLLLGFGMVLAGSSVHTVGSVSILERTRELATLRSLGFSARVTGWLVGMELYVLAAAGLLIGLPGGAYLNEWYMQSFSTENMSFRAIMPPWVYVASAAIVLALVGVSSWIAARRLAAMNLPQATKAAE